MRHFLHHLFIPRESNNHRAKVLHHDSLFVIIASFLLLFSLFATVHSAQPQVLGIATNISTQDLLNLTNQERAKAGVSPLIINSELTTAASQKATHMISHNYWAHIAPDGTTPWYFIRQSGYEYLYAGENLARGFTTAKATVDAWMASPTHRENMLSKNYKDIGFAVEIGNLTGSETTLIVEMFGSRYTETINKQSTANNQQRAVVPSPTIVTSVPAHVQLSQHMPVQVAAVQNKPLVDSDSMTKNISFFLLLFFIAVLIIDMIIIERTKIARMVAHNVDHILFFVIIILAIIIIGRGVIL